MLTLTFPESPKPEKLGRGQRKKKSPVRWIQESEDFEAQNIVCTAMMFGIKNIEASYLCQLKAIESFENATSEYTLVGADVGGGFENTQELQVMKYNEAMKSPDKEQWEKEIKEEHDRKIKIKSGFQFLLKMCLKMLLF